MKRILFVHHVSVIGGASYCMLNLLKNIDRQKVEPVVLLAKEGPLADEIQKLNIEVLYIRGLTCIPYNKSLLDVRTIQTYLHIQKIVPVFKALLIHKKIDVVYLNNVMLYPYLKPSKECNIKTVIHIREHWPEKEHRKQLNKLREHIKLYADHIIAINQYGANLVPNTTTKTSIVYDWIDFSDRYEKRPFNDIFKEDTSRLKIFVFTGGNSKWKGAAEVVEVFHKRIKNADCRLLIVGTDGRFPYVGFVGKVKKLLSFCGYVTYEKTFVSNVNADKRIVCIPATYKLKDIFTQSYAMLSFFTIPHANLALAEAITLGLPCVAAKTEESMEYTKNGVGAKLFQLNDKRDFEKKILELMDNYEEQKEKTLSISNEIKKKFDKNENIKVFNDIINSI